MEFSRIPRDRALMLLAECWGDEIWSPDHCRKLGVPDDWIDQLSDAYESGFDRDSQTIYVKNQQTNQYNGVRDVDLACQLGEVLGVDVQAATASAITRQATVSAIKRYLMDGE